MTVNTIICYTTDLRSFYRLIHNNPSLNDFSFLKSSSLPDCVWAADLWHGILSLVKQCRQLFVTHGIGFLWLYHMTAQQQRRAHSLRGSSQTERLCLISLLLQNHTPSSGCRVRIIRKTKSRSEEIHTFWPEQSFGGSTSWVYGPLKQWSGRAPRGGRSEPESHQNDSAEWIWGSMFFSWHPCCFQSEERTSELSIQSAQRAASWTLMSSSDLSYSLRCIFDCDHITLND